MSKIFGTDGVRGIFNKELTVDLSMKIGKAVAYVLAPNSGKIIIGKDTRLSSSSIECAIASGVCSCGSSAILAGVIPTPGVAYLTKKNKANAGIMISASHNSFEFNGIKIFDRNGYKISDETQRKIEDLIFSDFYGVSFPIGDKIGSIKQEKGYMTQYVNYLKEYIKSLDVKVMFDCANGASCNCASKVFRRMFHYDFMNNTPDGININKECGSTCLMPLSQKVTEDGYDLGIAYDGDADRCLAIDENGEFIDGDHIIGALALDMKEESNLMNNIVVGTTMSNMSLSDFLKKHNIEFIAAQIGDKFVSEEMRKKECSIGGEQSGHIIFSDYSTTGDGILTSIMLINLVGKLKKASKISNYFKKYPQCVKNLKIVDGNDFYNSDSFRKVLSKMRDILSEDGRILVRKSGTEPLVRVMIEAKNMQLLKKAEKELEPFE